MKQPPRREAERRIDRRGNKRTSETEELNGKCDAGGRSGEKTRRNEGSTVESSLGAIESVSPNQ